MSAFFKKHPDILICLTIAITTLAVYWQVGNHEFISFDDGRYVSENPKVQAGVSLENIGWAFGFTGISYWHPLTWLSHMLDCQLFGLNSGRHHMMNLMFHLANSLMLFYVFRRMTGDPWKSAFIAVLFGVHPINVESVAWVAERKNVLSTFFWMLTLISYSFYTTKPRLGRYVPTLLLFALGLLAKPAIVALPFVLLLLDYWPLNRFGLESLMGGSRRPSRADIKTWFQNSNIFRIVVEKIPFFVLAGGAIVLASLSTQHHDIVVSTHEVPVHLRLANGLVSYLVYLGKLFWPQKLAVFYPYPNEIPIWLTVAAGIWCISVSIIVMRWSVRLPYLFVGWFWYLGTLVPHIGLMQAGLWPALADRWAYIPGIGICTMVAWGIPKIIAGGQSGKYTIAVVTAVIVCLLTALTWKQVGYWQNNITLYQHAIDVTQDNDVVHNNLGAAFYYGARVDRAIYHFVEALKIQPGYAAAHSNLNKALGARSDINGAIEKMQKLLKIYPDIPALHYNLGNLYRENGQFDNAVLQYREALAHQPVFIQALNNLAGIYIIKKDYSTAIQLLQQIAALQPYDTDIYVDIARVYASQRQTRESIVWLKTAIDKGFCDWALLQTDRQLIVLKDTADYQDFLKSLQ